MTYAYVFNTRYKVKQILQKLSNIDSFNEFQSLCNASNLELGLDNTPMSDDDIAIIAKEKQTEIIDNDNNDEHEDSIVIFKEQGALLVDSSRGFRCVFLHDSSGKCTGCI